ncbi:aspartate aminotransferase family protein [Candidatus Thorarchaeota archaeon]|nr:MAG: aspartate aminotransferase family protein [Candidatus Thorarchaeota archaeon]
MDDKLVPKDLRAKYTDKDILEIEKKHLAPAVAHYYEKPLLFVGGDGATLVDHSGKKYIDLFAGICTTITGYSHPKFVATLKWQAEQLVYTSSLYATVPYAVLVKKLAEIAPKGLTQSFIVNSGSEANEAALFMARKFTDNPYILACHHAYHGRTILTRELSTAGWRTIPEPHPSGVRFVPNGYCYRCQFGKEYPECDFECARYMREVIRTETNRAIAAFIVEPIQGVGGIVKHPPEYLKITHETVKEFGGLFISDEVQTGFGRTGKKWWGIHQSEVNPDIITMAKGFGGGIPIGGFITRPEFASGYTVTDSFATFGGNPLSCAAAVAVIEIIQEGGYLEKAHKAGEHLKNRLLSMMDDHKIIGEVRGQGMMIGVELVRDRITKEPATKEMAKVMELCKDDGLLVGKGGFDGNVIRIQPPLELTMEQMDRACDILDKALTEADKML